MITHIVLLRPRPDAPEASLAALGDEVRALADAIPGIEEVRFGPDVSPEGLQDGHRWAFVVRFADAAARDAYLPHPAHEAFAARLGRLVEGVTVVDVDER